jgi:apolipoprotein N-acyltransferase
MFLSIPFLFFYFDTQHTLQNLHVTKYLNLFFSTKNTPEKLEEKAYCEIKNKQSELRENRLSQGFFKNKMGKIIIFFSDKKHTSSRDFATSPHIKERLENQTKDPASPEYPLTPSASYLSFFFSGSLWGMIVMGIGHLWILELYRFSSVLSIVILWGLYTCFMGLYFGLFGICYKLFHKWYLPALWTLIEYLRSYGIFGNPNMLIGYSQALNPILRHQAQYGGIFWVGFLLMCINVSLFYLWQYRKEKKGITYGFSILGIVLFMLSTWVWEKVTEYKNLSTLNVALIQGSHAQKNKLDHQDWNLIRKDYISMSLQLKTSPQLIMYPETITPGLNLDYPPFMEALKIVATIKKTEIAFGTPLFENGKFYNTVSIMTPRGLSPAVYRKTQLMPFGEYWPIRSFFSKILKAYVPENEYSPGFQNKPIVLSSCVLGPAICLESVYPSSLRSLRLQGANVFCVLANHAWFFNSSASQRHLYKSVFRSIENRCYLLQTTNDGISAIIDPHGAIQSQIKLNHQGSVEAQIKLGYPPTFYTQYGDWIIYICLFLCTIGLCKIYKKKSQK